jgi:hypothetical protein
MYTVVPVVLTQIEWFWNFNVEISILFFFWNQRFKFLKFKKLFFMLKKNYPTMGW